MKTAGFAPQTVGGYLLVAVLYVGNLITGVWALFHGALLTTPFLFYASLLNWACAWALCYVGFRRSRAFGKALAVLTLALTVLIFAGFLFFAWLVGAANE